MREIDYASWPRRETYEFFKPMAWPFWSVTFPVEVTGLRRWARENGASFYRAMVFAVTKSMEEVDAFLYKDRGGAIVKHDRLVPSFTDLRPGTENFYIVTAEAGEDMAGFCRRAGEIGRAQTDFMTRGPWEPDQLIYFTCLPWFPLTSLTNERHPDPADSVPRVSWGRYVEEAGGRTTLSLSLELNHRLLDGVHAGRLYEALAARLERL